MATATRKRSARTERRRAANTLVAHRERLIAESVPLEDLPDIDPSDAMQLVINRLGQLFRAASAEVDRLKPGLAKNQTKGELQHELWSSWDEQGNLVVMANYWVEREQKLREELARVTEKAQTLGLSERRTRVQEAQVQLVGEALQRAFAAADVPAALQRRVGAALRTELMTLESGAIVESVE